MKNYFSYQARAYIEYLYKLLKNKEFDISKTIYFYFNIILEFRNDIYNI